MDDTSEHSHEPTVDDLRVKLCYICREEECHDSPPHPPTVWTHPCKCTLVAHESCLLHWIKTQQRDFGRSRGDLKCPQCGELYEFEGFNPRILRIFNTVNRTLSLYGRIVTVCCVGTVILSSGAGIYLACTSYGAFAVREFVGPDIFRALLTSNPSNWPWHAWFYLPIIPFSLVVSRTPLAIWTSSPLVPLVPLLFPWSYTVPVSVVAGVSSRRVQFDPFVSRPKLWPPPPALVCALFPVVRVLYGRLRDRIIWMMVQDFVPTWIRATQQWLQRRGVPAPAGMQEAQLRGDRQQRLQQLRIQIRARQQRQRQQPQPQPQQQQRVGPGAGRRFHFQLGQLFGFEIAHFVWERNPPAVGEPVGPGPGPGVAAVGDAANGGDGRAVDNPADPQQQPHRDGPVQEPERGPPALAPADQDPQQQQQQPPPVQQQQPPQVQQEPQQQQPQQQQQQPPPEPQQQQRAEQGQEPLLPAIDEDNLGAMALRAIGVPVTGGSLGRLVGGALLMPSIARMMGSMLLHISHHVPLIRTIIAPLPPPLLHLPPSPPPSGPISTLVRLILGARADTVVGHHGDGHGWLSGSSLGALVLRGLFATSQEWATSDPVWWRNTLGLGIFLVVKDGLKLFHLWLAKRELEERHIKNKSFAGIDLTGLELVERQKPEA